MLSHINLLLVGYLIKRLSPKTKLVLFAHGIEVWKPLPGWKRKMLARIDLILPVSGFTKKVMQDVYGLPDTRFRVVNNCLDPFLTPRVTNGRSKLLMDRYGLKVGDEVLMTLSRLSEKERYKGYDKVLLALKALKPDHPNLRYLIIGKYDDVEKERVDEIIDKLHLKDSVVFAGFIPDEEIAEHFNLADVYVMPSEKEGFGIVFIEAMFYGLPVIAGNVDGSVDALCNGSLGLLVNPEKEEEVLEAIRSVVENNSFYIPSIQKLNDNFSFPVYKHKLKQLII